MLGAQASGLERGREQCVRRDARGPCQASDRWTTVYVVSDRYKPV